uniref:Uncharacterized protein n=1 Tax=Panagrellus redivivus TaxID=6233 RepID=A0A7E4W7H0_PANRE
MTTLRLYSPQIVVVLAVTALTFVAGNTFRIPFELDTDLRTVTCRKCIQMWAHDPALDDANPLSCGPHSQTCSGNACFMRQCKRCGMYQYISGCVRLTDWQLRDMQLARNRLELKNTRTGASMLCEDNANHTTCICNRRDRCNDIHARVPFSTYAGSLFETNVNIDAAIASIDPSLVPYHRPQHVYALQWYPRNLGSTLRPVASIFTFIFAIAQVWF